jgi:hypothetical protein
VEDEDLLTIRSGGSYARLLQPLDNVQKATWMWANYGLALLALATIGVVWYLRRRGEQPMELVGAPGIGEGEAPAGGVEPAKGAGGAGTGNSDEGGQHD